MHSFKHMNPRKPTKQQVPYLGAWITYALRFWFHCWWIQVSVGCIISTRLHCCYCYVGTISIGSVIWLLRYICIIIIWCAATQLLTLFMTTIQAHTEGATTDCATKYTQPKAKKHTQPMYWILFWVPTHNLFVPGNYKRSWIPSFVYDLQIVFTCKISFRCALCVSNRHFF